MTASAWRPVLELDSTRAVTTGSETALTEAIGRGADLRIYTEFRHNEHIDLSSKNSEWIHEVAEFPVTYLLEKRWAAGIMTLRQPIGLPDGFGPRPSMSFFLYNQDGQQGIARPHLDGQAAGGKPGPSGIDPDFNGMAKYHQGENQDAETNAPSGNFIYDFERFRFFVRDDWSEALAHDANGEVVSGSLEALVDAFRAGAEIKVAIRGAADALSETVEAIEHELFVETHSGYYYTEAKRFIAGTQPIVRVRPSIPLLYRSQGWDFGWLVPRTDGQVAGLIYDPYTLETRRHAAQHAIRWFTRP